MFLGYQKVSMMKSSVWQYNLFGVLLMGQGRYSLLIGGSICQPRSHRAVRRALAKVWPLLRKTDIGLWEQEIPFDVGRILRFLMDLSNHIEAVHDSSMIGNWIHLFIDGAVKLDARFATFGEMAYGFTFIHERGCQKVVIHMDNLEVVKAIQIAHLADSFSALLRRIHMSLQAIQHWKIKHVPREWNEVVDRIVKLATVRSTNMQIFEDIREELILLF
ncbi:hypothetical protein Gotur_012650 [Gossypium turneri]